MKVVGLVTGVPSHHKQLWWCARVYYVKKTRHGEYQWSANGSPKHFLAYAGPMRSYKPPVPTDQVLRRAEEFARECELPFKPKIKHGTRLDPLEVLALGAYDEFVVD